MSDARRGIRFGLRLAVRLLPQDVREEVLGDLIEAWNERRRSHTWLSRVAWTWKQPLAALSSRIVDRDSAGDAEVVRRAMRKSVGIPTN